MTRGDAWVERLERAFGGGGFAAFVLWLVLLYEIAILALWAFPGSAGGLGAFAEEFRVWCLGYDPATGRFDWAFPVGMLVPPLFLAAFVALFWWGPLRRELRRPSRLAVSGLAALGLLGIGAGGFATAGGEGAARGELPFPAEALRMAQAAPALDLVDQRREPVELAALRGRVVVLTAVYASCPHTCPRILAQVKEALASLDPSEREQVRVVAVTLDPRHDSPAVLAELARRHGLEAPLYRLATGDEQAVERVLDQMDVTRRRDPATGIIEHPNLFLLLDRQGRVAYRLTLGERQQRWMVAALRVLLREPSDEA